MTHIFAPLTQPVVESGPGRIHRESTPGFPYSMTGARGISSGGGRCWQPQSIPASMSKTIPLLSRGIH